MHLPHRLTRRSCVHRAPDQYVERATARAIRNEPSPGCVHREPYACSVHVDALTCSGLRGVEEHDDEREGGEERAPHSAKVAEVPPTGDRFTISKTDSNSVRRRF